MSAPVFNAVNAFTGDVAEDRPSKFFQANAEADERLTEFERLKRDNAKLREQLDALLSSPVAELHCRIQELTAERDQLADDLVCLRDTHQITLGRLATANAAVAHAERLGL